MSRAPDVLAQSYDGLVDARAQLIAAERDHAEAVVTSSATKRVAEGGTVLAISKYEKYEKVIEGADRAAGEAKVRAVGALARLEEAEAELGEARKETVFARADGDGQREREMREATRRLEKTIVTLRAAIDADEEEARVQGEVAAEARKRMAIAHREQAEAMRPAYLLAQRNILELADKLLAALLDHDDQRHEISRLVPNVDLIVGQGMGSRDLLDAVSGLITEAATGVTDCAGLSFRTKPRGDGVAIWVIEGGECDRR